MLITTTQELKQYVNVGNDLRFESIAPTLRHVERRYTQPLVGNVLYAALHEAYEESSLNAIQHELRELMNAITAPLALWQYSQEGGLQIDDSGIYKQKNDNRWNLSEGEQQRLEALYLQRGLEAQEELLAFLDTHTADLPTYAPQPERGRLVRSGEVVRELFAVMYPRVLFRALREALHYVEDNRLAPALTPAYCAQLLAVAEADLSADERAIRKLARHAAIYLAVSRALLTRTVKLTHNGLDVLMGPRTQITEPENARIEAAAATFAQSGEQLLAELEALITENAPTGYNRPTFDATTLRDKNPLTNRILLI